MLEEIKRNIFLCNKTLKDSLFPLYGTLKGLALVLFRDGVQNCHVGNVVLEMFLKMSFYINTKLASACY
jgi:hypothetical protein